MDTAGKNAKKIAEYIQNQLKEDQIGDQMTIKEYIDPFTGRGHSWSCYILQGRFKLYSLQYRRFFGTPVISVSE